MSSPGPFPQETYTVSQLGNDVAVMLREVYPAVWVVGEVQRLKRHRNGQVYFELVEKGVGDRVQARIDAVIWDRDQLRIQRLMKRAGVELTDGTQLRCRCELGFWTAAGRVQISVREVDPTFALGALALRREETHEALVAEGLIERNKRLRLASVPLRIGLVTSDESAAARDFLSTLEASGYGFWVLFAHATVQGAAAEAAVSRAIARLAAAITQGRVPLDCIAVVRGGGAKSDLAVFDSRRVARAVALAPVPVLTGLGHEIDRSIADEVAHSAFKTPTGVAESLVQRASEAERRVEAAHLALSEKARSEVQRAGLRLERSITRLQTATRRLSSQNELLDQLLARLHRAARDKLQRGERSLERAGRRLGEPVRHQLEVRARVCEQLEQSLLAATHRTLRTARMVLDERHRLCRQLSPERLLRRGFSITRGPDGSVVRTRAAVAAGAELTTQVLDGIIASRVTADRAADPRRASPGDSAGARGLSAARRSRRVEKTSSRSVQASLFDSAGAEREGEDRGPRPEEGSVSRDGASEPLRRTASRGEEERG